MSRKPCLPACLPWCHGAMGAGGGRQVSIPIPSGEIMRYIYVYLYIHVVCQCLNKYVYVDYFQGEQRDVSVHWRDREVFLCTYVYMKSILVPNRLNVIAVMLILNRLRTYACCTYIQTHTSPPLSSHISSMLVAMYTSMPMFTSMPMSISMRKPFLIPILYG